MTTATARRQQPPLILITTSTQQRGVEFSDCSMSLSHRYPEAVQAAGGLPWVCPSTLPAEAIDDCVRRSDGVMLTGGDDVQTQLYTSELPRQLKAKVGPPDSRRDWVEFQVIEAVFRQRKPLLAICRGQQVLNVAFGGTLVADIQAEVPAALNHQCFRRKDQVAHKVSLLAGSELAKIAGKNWLGVNSSHHQAVKRVAEPFQVTAASSDGIAEALELKSADAQLLPYLLAVQFHPERLLHLEPVFLDLFRSFVVACRFSRKRSL
jgi:putative glutamine amidotransferase